MNKKFLLSIPLACIMFLGCSDESKDEAKEVANTTIDKVAEVTNKTVEKASTVVEEVKKETAPVVNEVVESSKEVVTEVAKKAIDVKETVQNKIHEATAPSVDVKALYTRCASCHGQNAEKKALNSSQVIKGWSKDKILTALRGYKSGIYGGAMKGVMVGQLKSLNDGELEALASHISSL